MSGRSAIPVVRRSSSCFDGGRGTISRALLRRLIVSGFIFAACAAVNFGQERREREPNSVYAARRAKLASQVDAPILLWAFTGREESAQTYVFEQEENFYYLTGHNEEGAGLILLPGQRAKGDAAAPSNLPQETLFLPARDSLKEKWNGARMSPADPGIEARTGFHSVKPFSEMRLALETLAKKYSTIYTILPYEKENGGYPHEKAVTDWIKTAAPQVKLKDIRSNIITLREIKSPGEISFLSEAIDLSLDGQLAAMHMMRPGLYEYQVAAKMTEVHATGGSESEGYAPIVGAGPNSTVLHYDKLSRKIQDGDIVVLDVAARYAGYSADITRTLPANGKFTSRQREIYDIVLGAQNAALAALKPGMDYCRGGAKSIYRIAFDYINSHGKDLHGETLGKYFIHGLGHDIGLDVHDPGEYCKPLEPGMVVTVEPGIYIPEENLGVRIEDDVLITDTGYKFLSQRLPRDPDEIEKIMADAAAQRAKNEANDNSAAKEDASPRDTASDIDAIKGQVAKYARSVDDVDLALAAQVWWDSPEVSFVHPLGHDRGFEQIKADIYQKIMGGFFTDRHLSPRDIAVHLYRDSAVVEFYWDFTAKMKKDGSPVTTHGRETQIYERIQGIWRLVHVHYSPVPPAQVGPGA
ncbi:MAG TPA: aminopeptidase P N-terminal domain-containing protein [Candidatus Methylomirabilis sp.]|nr:aminopeptidase P N-terminal domain-containing protein [Candidatus Methylomirabilis sp.]